MALIHLVEGGKPEEGKIVQTKCGMELAFNPFAPSLEKRVPICGDCASSRPTKIPNFLSVMELPLSKHSGA